MANVIALACSAAFPTTGSKTTLIKAMGIFNASEAPCKIKKHVIGTKAHETFWWQWWDQKGLAAKARNLEKISFYVILNYELEEESSVFAIIITIILSLLLFG